MARGGLFSRGSRCPVVWAKRLNRTYLWRHLKRSWTICPFAGLPSIEAALNDAKWLSLLVAVQDCQRLRPVLELSAFSQILIKNTLNTVDRRFSVVAHLFLRLLIEIKGNLPWKMVHCFQPRWGLGRLHGVKLSWGLQKCKPSQIHKIFIFQS